MCSHEGENILYALADAENHRLVQKIYQQGMTADEREKGHMEFVGEFREFFLNGKTSEEASGEKQEKPWQEGEVITGYKSRIGHAEGIEKVSHIPF